MQPAATGNGAGGSRQSVETASQGPAPRSRERNWYLPKIVSRLKDGCSQDCLPHGKSGKPQVSRTTARSLALRVQCLPHYLGAFNLLRRPRSGSQQRFHGCAIVPGLTIPTVL